MKKILKTFSGLPKEVYVICFARMVNAMGAFIFPLLTMILTRKIGTSREEAGFWIMLVGIVWFPASIIGGKLTDCYGRKKVIILCDTIGGLLYIICGFLPASYMQMVIILVACYFFGMAEPANNAIVADLTTPENRDSSYALSYMCFNLGFAVGPFVGGQLFEKYYAWIFWGDAITLMISVALLTIFVRETLPVVEEKMDKKRAMESHVEGSIFKVLKERRILIVFPIILLFYNLCYAQWHFLLPLQMEDVYGNRGPALFGQLASLNGLVVIVCTPLLTAMFKDIRGLKKIALGGVLQGLGLCMFGVFSKSAMLYYAVSCIIFTLGEILITTNYMPFISNRTPASHRGRMNSIVPMIMGAGYSIGPWMMGNGLKFFSIEMGWVIVGVIMAFGVVCMLVLNRIDTQKAYEIGVEDSGMSALSTE